MSGKKKKQNKGNASEATTEATPSSPKSTPTPTPTTTNTTSSPKAKPSSPKVTPASPNSKPQSSPKTGPKSAETKGPNSPRENHEKKKAPAPKVERKISPSEFDLTNKFVLNLDRHIIYQLLTFLSEKNIYPEEDMTRAKFALLSGTKMIDAAEEEYKKLNHTEESRPEIEAQSDAVFAELERRKESCAVLLGIIQDELLMRNLREQENFNMEYLSRNYPNFSQDTVENLYHYAKMLYETGQYMDAASSLKAVLQLTNKEELRYAGIWGKLAAEIQSFNWGEALEDAKLLRQEIDSRVHKQELELLQQRTWLLHWSMFPYFKAPNGPSVLLEDIFQQPKLVSAIQLTSPHLIRYLGAAMIISKQHKSHMGNMVRMLKVEKDNYADPITQFLTALLVDFEFESIAVYLKECEVVLDHDYFLSDHKAAFMEQAQSLVFETICKVHKCVSLDLLVKSMNLEEVNTEQQVIDLIRRTNANAKIDTSKNQLVVATNKPSLHRNVLTRTKDIFDEKPDKSRKYKKSREDDGEEPREDQSKWDTIVNRLMQKRRG